MKKIIVKSLSNMGYSVSKIKKEDMDLYYQIYDKKDIEEKKFYNIGAGAFRHPAWTNIDYYSEWFKENKIDISFNLLECKPLPLDDNSANIFYSSHTVEHITDKSAQNIFNEIYRTLKKEGYARLTTVDIDLCYKAVLNNDIHFWQREREMYSDKKNMDTVKIAIPMGRASIRQLFLFSFASQTSLLHIDKNTYKISDKEFNEIFSKFTYEKALDYCKSKCNIELQSKYPGNHINWWNKDKLSRMLQFAGFKKIYLSGYGQSFCPVLRNTTYFDNSRPNYSIYVEARK
ncbi:MAG: methyltransferase domain-containing protein [bacterium]